ncbi:hypothetical protein PM082_012982 [Marasmius tenuissimus]|nr:hypothetical protein PM082_012982 [Marasmius tenuissimus]
MPPSRTDKKKPPTFNHFPAARAKALKQTWVEKAKIKSKWKAERRKLGLAPAQVDRNPIRNGSEEEADEEEGSQDGQRPSVIEQDEDMPAPKKSLTAFQLRREKHKHSTPQNGRGSQSKPQPTQNSDDTSVDLRELARKAYSRESLHTYKSDPLKRRAHGEYTKKGGGRGQPNMKLRMNVMLEKIKKDYS